MGTADTDPVGSDMSAMTIMYIGTGVLCAGLLVQAIWIDREPIRARKRYRRELPKRIAAARQEVRQLFRESHRRMDRLAGKKDDFHLGPWGDW